MCKDKISFTIPQDPYVLRATAKMLLNLAEEEGCTECLPDEGHNAPESPLATVAAQLPDPATHTGGPLAPAPEPVPAPPAAAPAPEPDTTTMPVPPPESAPAPPAAAPVPEAVPIPEPITGPIEGPQDVAGHPWDARIHASTKATMKDGTWKLKRGSDPNLVAQLRAEWDARNINPPPASAQTPAATPVPEAAPVPPAAAPAPPVPPVVTEIPTTYPEIVAVVTNKQELELLTVEEVQSVVAALGLPSFPALAAKQELIPQVYTALEAIWTTRTAS